MKTKYVTKSKKDFMQWIALGNLFAKSLCPCQEVLKQYNGLSASQRLEIKKALSKYDELRRTKIPTDEATSAWEIGIMVDAHILATEYNIDPLTIVLCVHPICKPNEKVLIK